MLKKIAEEISPEMKVFSTIGNHDVWPVDQLKFPPNIYLNKLARIWAMHKYPQDAIEQINAGGHYSVLVSRGLRVISINTQWTNDMNFWLYVNWNTDHGRFLFFLENELSKALRQNEKVIILGHIWPNSRYPEWKKIALIDIIEKYQNVIVGQFYGHNHCDKFGLIVDKNNKPISQMFISTMITNNEKKIQLLD